jgi:hypothetical protein
MPINLPEAFPQVTVPFVTGNAYTEIAKQRENASRRRGGEQ